MPTYSLLEALLQATPGFLYVVDKKGQLLAANQAILKILGLKTASALKGNFYTTLLEKTRWSKARIQLLEEQDREILGLNKPQYATAEPPITDARGMHFYYESTRIPCEGPALVVSLLDITIKHALNTHTHESTQSPTQSLKSPYPPGVIRDPSHPPSILVIEDNPVAQQSARAMLTSLECEIDLAATEAELSKRFHPGKYDFILMDIGLEGTSGYLLAKKIRQLENQSGYCVPIIALTGFDVDVVKTDCDYYFMEGALAKPLTIEQARQLIQRYVYQIPIPIQGLKSLKYQPPLAASQTAR